MDVTATEFKRKMGQYLDAAERGPVIIKKSGRVKSVLISSGYPEYRRIDIGEYRIIYRIDDDTVKVCVIGKRNDDDVYKRFKRSS